MRCSALQLACLVLVASYGVRTIRSTQAARFAGVVQGDPCRLSGIQQIALFSICSVPCGHVCGSCIVAAGSQSFPSDWGAGPANAARPDPQHAWCVWETNSISRMEPWREQHGQCCSLPLPPPWPTQARAMPGPPDCPDSTLSKIAWGVGSSAPQVGHASSTPGSGVAGASKCASKCASNSVADPGCH